MHIDGGAREVKHQQHTDKTEWHREHDDERPHPRSEQRDLKQIDKDASQSQTLHQIAERLVHARVLTPEADMHSLGQLYYFEALADFTGNACDVAVFRVDKNIGDPPQT